MSNKLVRFAAVAAVSLVLIVGPGQALGQTSSPVLAVPSGYTVIPPNDVDRSDDQILQLENLTIQNLSGSVPGIIYASHDIGGPCREYTNLQSAAARIYPCPLAPDVLYQIAVQADTILLLKDRSRAAIGDLAVGDRINVFGFLDAGTSGVQALIIRDLDKPALAQYVQLNDLTIVSGPSAAAPPATFQAARKGMEPCLRFAPTAVKGAAIPCPLGVDVATSAEALKSPAAELYRPFRQYYTIQVSAATKLLGFSRAGINLSDIQAGDHVNVYGRYFPGTRSIEAAIVRDVSVSSTGQPSLVVSVAANRIVCITTPCGQIDGVRVDIHWLDFEGDDTPSLVTSAFTAHGQATFRNVKPGRYLVTASGAGYASVGEQIVLQGAAVARVSLILSLIDDGNPTSDIQVVYPNRGESLRRGSSLSLRWEPDPSVSNAADLFLVSPGCGANNPPEMASACVTRDYTIARGVGQADSDGTMSYVWTVPDVLEKILLGDGNYHLKVCYAGTDRCDLSDSAFKVISATSSVPSISSISPSQGTYGTPVTLKGKFAPSGNYVYMGGFVVAGNVASNGTSLTFSIPEYVSPCGYSPYDTAKSQQACIMIAMQLKPSQYSVQVVNAAGKSNAVSFMLNESRLQTQ